MDLREAKALVRNGGYVIVEERVARPDTRVILSYHDYGKTYHGVGKCSHKRSDADSGDPRCAWDEALGIKIATGRAEKDIAEQLVAESEKAPMREWAINLMKVGEAYARALHGEGGDA